MSSRSSLRNAGTLALLLSAASLLITGCKPAGPPPGAAAAQGPLPVQVVTSTLEDVPVTGQWVATTDGNVNAQIQPQVSGYLIRQDYKEGSDVHKGQVLFEIDPRPFQALVDQAKGTLAQAQGQVGQAQAQLALAAINVKRDTPLAAEHAIAQSQLDTETQTQAVDKAAVTSAQAQVTSAQAQVETAQLNLGFTKVRSLIDGVAGQAALQVGNLVNTSSVLTSVSQVNPIKAYFYISEQEYLSLSARAKQKGVSDLLNSGSAIPLHLELSNNKEYPQIGRISFVDRSVSAQTGSIRLAAVFPNPGNVLRPGQFGRISAQTDILHHAIIVPQRAVTELQGQNQVIVVTPDNVAHLRNVTIGTQINTTAGQSIVITSGINAGDTVVTEGLDKVKDGTKVAPQPDHITAGAPAPSTQPGQGN
jgi:membrane fusion protein (multidrug efflux system)